MRIVVSGSIGRLPLGGHAWIQMQYLAGLRRLGHEVLYLEDCGDESWVYHWQQEAITHDLDYPGNYVAHCLRTIGAPDCWTYRAGDRAVGLSIAESDEWCGACDLFIAWAVPIAQWRPAYLAAKRRIFIDVDPGFIQFRMAAGDPALNATADSCHALFTIAQRMGEPDCPIPTAGRAWRKTVPPIVLSHWPASEPCAGGAGDFTSVMQWRGFHDVTWQGERYGQKDVEFPRFIDLPRHTPQPLRLALTGSAPDDVARNGWKVAPGYVSSETPESYARFIRNSRAEFGVAKHGYVKSRGGWFSDRSVCYLASAKPVLVQNTGQDAWLPTGRGIVTFKDMDGALAGIESINADYEAHCRAARAIAEDVFDADKVLPRLLADAMEG